MARKESYREGKLIMSSRREIQVERKEQKMSRSKEMSKTKEEIGGI